VDLGRAHDARHRRLMKLYSGPLSLFSAKARIALGEKGLAHELVQVGWSPAARYEPHHPDVVRLNPKAQVPVLVDGDVVLWDSTLIAEYLEERAPTPPLFPHGVAARARCRQQEAAADEVWFPPLWTFIEARVYAGGESPALDAAARRLVDLYRGFDEALDAAPYHGGAAPSVADIATFVMARTASVLSVAVPPQLDRMTAWMERMGERPAVRTVIDDMNAAAARAFGR
jgi:glutathione S-transferase